MPNTLNFPTTNYWAKALDRSMTRSYAYPLPICDYGEDKPVYANFGFYLANYLLLILPIALILLLLI